ncbi:MAG TPA: serine/threonine protein phosphatase, partial [Prevotella sp.]|nr:serine/threonine protein phosphatase [Prevotella sp.]
MISRIFIPILLAIVLPDLYFDQHYWRSRYHGRWWLRLLWWLPGMLMFIYTIALVSIRDFVPADLTWINVYMFLVGLIVWPKAIFALCSGLGLLWSRWRHSRVNLGNIVAVVLILINWYVLIYGSTIGTKELTVQRNDLYFTNLPERFDGYRIVFFSDAHVGSFTGARRTLLQRDIDSINAQRADLIAFGGDLQNIRPQEIVPVMPLLRQLRARDGVVSVLGNHDYSEYTHDRPDVEAANCRLVIDLQRRMGWKLLLNSHFALHRSGDSIVVAGEQNFR